MKIMSNTINFFINCSHFVQQLVYNKIVKEFCSLIFFLREFQPMVSALDDSSFIIRSKHQSVFGVGRD